MALGGEASRVPGSAVLIFGCAIRGCLGPASGAGLGPHDSSAKHGCSHLSSLEQEEKGIIEVETTKRRMQDEEKGFRTSARRSKKALLGLKLGVFRGQI